MTDLRRFGEQPQNGLWPLPLKPQRFREEANTVVYRLTPRQGKAQMVQAATAGEAVTKSGLNDLVRIERVDIFQHQLLPKGATADDSESVMPPPPPRRIMTNPPAGLEPLPIRQLARPAKVGADEV